MIKNRISLFVATFLIIGFFFLALPEKGYSGIPTECCQSTPTTCFDANGGGLACVVPFQEGAVCIDGMCTSPQVINAVPTLSELGLIAMASILGLVGFMVIRRRKVTA
jgi:IPTL-CTERM motif